MEFIYGTKLYQRFRGILVCIIDLILTLCSYVFVFLMDNGFFLEGKFFHITRLILWGMLFVLILHLFSQLIFRTHKILWAYTGPSEVVRSFLSSLFCLIVMLFFQGITKLFHPSLIIISELISFIFSLGVRLLYRNLRRYALSAERKQNALIVGAGSAGYLMLSEIYRNTKYPYNVVGFLDDFKAKGMILSGKPVLGRIDEVEKVAKDNGVSQIFIAVSSITPEQKRRIINLCTSTSITTKVMNFSVDGDSQQHVSVEEIQIEDLLNRPSIDLKIEEIASYLIDKTICVTGAGGSIGSELCRQIVRFKPKLLIMIDINENSLYMLEQEFMRKKRQGEVDNSIEILSLIVSIRERDELSKVFHEYNCDVVYHAAAHKHVPLMETRPSEAILNNILGTKNVIDAAIDSSVSRLIMISTDKAVNPTNVMGATKRMTELILQSRETNKQIKMAAVRFGNVLGSSGSVIPIFREQIKQGGPVTLTDKNVSRYFMTIPEAAQLVLQAGYYAKHREIFVLDMGEPVKILDLAEKMIRLAGYKPYQDIEIREIGLRPGEKMFEELTLEIEKCHKTDNNLIFVHEPIQISQEDIDKKIEILSYAAKNINDPKKLKQLLMDSIKDESIKEVQD